MIDTYARHWYQKILVDPVAKVLEKKLAPNVITLFACLFGILSAGFIACRMPWIATILLLISGYLDTLDGSIARRKQSVSDKGCALDIFCDRTVEAAIIFGLFYFNPYTRAIPSMCMALSVLLCITSFLVVGIFNQNDSKKSFFYSVGIMERTEAFIFFILMVLIPSWFSLFAYIFSLLVLITALIRIVQFVKSS